MRSTGRYELRGAIQYFIPDSLPPQAPPFAMNEEIAALYGDAMLHLGKLNELANNVPDMNRFIKAYIIKEALLSSAIEGIHTTLLDVFTQPLLEEKPTKNTQLVMNYTAALEATLAAIKKEGLGTLESTLLEAHKILIILENDNHADPGRYRKHPVRVGMLIPPPADLVPGLMADLMNYITHRQKKSRAKDSASFELPPLIKAGLAHVQFETIHPFLDGNGRIGRLLIVIMLIESGLLSTPILYPSYYFKKHHMEYYYHLDMVRTHGDFEGWILFYLTAVRDSSIDAYKRAKDILALQQRLTELITTHAAKKPTTKLHALSILFSYPAISVTKLATELDTTYNTARQVIDDFIDLGFLDEDNEQKRGKIYKFKDYLAILERVYDRGSI